MSEVFRTPDERFEDLEGYDFEPNYLDLTGDLDGLRMHYVDEGEGDPDPPAPRRADVVVPVPEDDPRSVGVRAGSWLPIYIGFGRSDKVTEIGLVHLRPSCRLRETIHRGLDLRDITLVVHDWGGPIGLRLAVEDEDRFSRLVILNTAVFRRARESLRTKPSSRGVSSPRRTPTCRSA